MSNNDNSWTLFPSSSTGEQNQVPNNNNNHSFFLPSMMQRLSFNNNYQGELDDVALMSHNIGQSSASNYDLNHFPSRNRFVLPVVRAEAPALYHQHPAVTSFNEGTENYFHALSAQLTVLCDFAYGSPYLKSKALFEYILLHPYVAMVTPETYQGFLSILDFCSYQTLNGILEKMAEFPDDYLVTVSCHIFGYQVIKKLISLARRLPSVIMFPRVFATRIVVMMNNQFGCRAIKACLRLLYRLKNEPLYEEMIRHCLEIATNRYGCFEIQKCIGLMDNCHPSQLCYGQDNANAYSPRDRLLKAISNHAASLAENYYGIFVLQYLIGKCPEDCLKSISVGLKPLYETLCTSENGSFLVEKILGTPYKTLVAEALLECNHLAMIARNEYGNYAIQTLLMKIKEHKADYYQKLCEKLSQDLGTLENSLCGKYVAYLVKDGLKDDASENEICKGSKKVTTQRGAISLKKKSHKDRA